MTLEEVLADAIKPALAYLPPKMDGKKAHLELLTIGLQESGFKTRFQMGNGPARGFWQFEQGGGVKGVLTHSASRPWMLTLCAVRDVQPHPTAVWHRLAQDDVFAAGVARLLLWTDPKPLPDLDDAEGAWAYYFRNWRPGKPHRDTWDAYHQQARAALGLGDSHA